MRNCTHASRKRKDGGSSRFKCLPGFARVRRSCRGTRVRKSHTWFPHRRATSLRSLTMAAPSLSLTRIRPATPVAESSRLYAERAVAGIALAVLAPGLACVLGAVKLLSGRSPLVAHHRVGRYGESFWVLK